MQFISAGTHGYLGRLVRRGHVSIKTDAYVNQYLAHMGCLPLAYFSRGSIGGETRPHQSVVLASMISTVVDCGLTGDQPEIGRPQIRHQALRRDDFEA
jgi:hypothetical protein